MPCTKGAIVKVLLTIEVADGNYCWNPNREDKSKELPCEYLDNHDMMCEMELGFNLLYDENGAIKKPDECLALPTKEKEI